MKLTKTLLIAPLVAGALISTSFAADNKSDISYSVGYTMGKTLQAQMQQGNVSADNNQLIDGLKDGIDAKKPKLTPEQMQNAMLEFQKQAQASADQKNAQ
ncbi:MULTISPECIES: FKBP-type peptidyl-prolyl cis-trans isomerase N-terminal domain-containing protein [unclassified Francisella]|uniref:FKBP-type peptidyl-prolyl cis-trans isomerase N-terminal domain-containing protein n=1 Tax=unclassified Francisella TaxID=2610885 RepID=UPI002E3334EF|nr:MULTISPECIES: FKBP-type peptidyl-prolyl cis-trans isomerase N-terminal domain-containing protein [unclassified Francisella]MED7819915.1 FKBP-type peptidyl-prolyl cis-trans isomerase N-terminal domain-containing protein [Francisella sp. 19S2-4]MED7830735.1 FKBP-type peptidyl-prolyl cis-trans isomerase N-terminal domain-containing protein [Francisella sp. 19S2-10]